MFFLNYREKCIQIFNANWLKIEKKNIRYENHDYNNFLNQTIFEFENRNYNDFSNQKHETYLHMFEIFVAKYTKFFLLFQEISMLKRKRV